MRHLLWALIVGLLLSTQVLAGDRDPRMTGLVPMTAEEAARERGKALGVRKIRWNRLGVSRLNKVRKNKGKPALDVLPAAIGTELEAAPGATAEEGTSSAPGELPGSVDNSTLKYFPPIRSQGSLGSCGSFSGTYYTMTYMYALAHDLDAKNGGDSNRFSPKFTYNFVNGGANVGSWYYWCFNLAMKHGCVTWAQFPYDSNYKAWCLDTETYREAITKRFQEYGYVNSTNTDAGIDQVKQMLVNGYILNFPTYINSWQWKTIGNDPSTTLDDAYAGKSACYWVNGTNGYHAMTVVGYNDNIWVDINSNGTVDTGEKGAFRIANSWGTGWREAGFAWMSYDALKSISAVTGAPSTGRTLGWSPAQACWTTARVNYQPRMLAQFTLNHAKRNQMRVTLGVSDTNTTTPTTSWYPSYVLSYAGGAYAFDGSTTARDGTFYFDFTDILPTGSESKRYYLGVYDNATGDIATIKTYKIIDLDNAGVETICDTVPKTADAAQTYAFVDYAYFDGNYAPEAIASGTPTSGYAPLTVQFDGTLSTDTDGTIVSYDWNFADGSTGSGATVSHTFQQPGTYNVVLTITDDRGATDTDIVQVVVAADPNKVIFVQDISMSAITVRKKKAATATILIKNVGGNVQSGATVTGSWSGIVSGTSTGTTGADGKVTLQSPNSRTDGTFTFTVSYVSGTNGFTYDAARNVETSDSIGGSVPPPPPPPPLEAPSNLQSSVAGGTVTLSWTDNSADEDGFTVERGTLTWLNKKKSKIVWSDAGTVGANITSFSETVASGDYNYRVKATRNDGTTSADSNEVSVTVP